MKLLLNMTLLGLLWGCGDGDTTANSKPEVAKSTDKQVQESAKKPTLEQIKEAAKAPQQPKMNEGDGGDNPLLNPSLAKETAPNTYDVLLETTKGNVLITVQRDWAPNGADQFYNLVKIGYFTDIAFFRVLGGFMAQFGMHGDPTINTAWRSATIQDDPVRESNKRGFVTFAKTNAPNSRSTQLFINYKDNARLDSMVFAPIGKVVEEPGKGGGMMVIDKLYAEYGEGAPSGRGPSQMKLAQQGNAYLKAEYPNLDYIKSAHICGAGTSPDSAKSYCP